MQALNAQTDFEPMPDSLPSAQLPERKAIPAEPPSGAKSSNTGSATVTRLIRDKTFRFGTVGYIDRKISPKQLRQNPQEVLAAWERVKDKARKIGFTGVGKVYVEPTKTRGSTHAQVFVCVEIRGQRIIGRGTDLIENQVLGELARAVCQDENGVTQVQLGWGWSVYGTG